MLDFIRRDIIFLHAPSVYDFRKDTILFGPVSDVVPSSSVFEMYPVGITSIADHLEREGFHVQLINAAYRMLRDPNYDPEEDIRRNTPRVWALDLHWLPHAHGALAMAALIKKHHPNTPVLMGGISSSYYHEELIANPNIDFVIRGDSCEEPVLELLKRLRTGEPLEGVPNLTWKQHGVSVVNPLTNVPNTLDGPNIPAYRYSMRSVFKYANVHNIVPYLRWLRYPMTALLTARGCSLGCSICGGSRDSYEQICNRTKPAFRSPEKLAQDVRFINRFSRAPIFVIHDIRMQGREYARKFLSLLRQEQVENEIVLELFGPADETFLMELNDSCARYSLELTLETHDEELRRLNGKFPVSNASIERTIELALANGCRRLDIYFMVGIPKQTRESALASIDYGKQLLEKYGRDGRLQLYVAPLAPFLDPGSPAFENPEQFGYKLRARTLEEHRQRLTLPTWSQILNYESLTLPPDELVDTTYEASARLVKAKAEVGLLTPEAAEKTLAMIAGARELLTRIEAASQLPGQERAAALDALRQEVKAINSSRVYDQTEFVSWGGPKLQLKPLGLAVLMAELFFEELSLAWRRYSRKLHTWKRPRTEEQTAD